MRTLVMVFLVLVMTPAITFAEPQRIEDPKPTCDNRPDTDLPPCEKNPVKSDRPAHLPSEGDSVTVPPEIPAEGLPQQDRQPSSGNNPNQPQH